MWLTCVLAVSGLMTRRPAISALLSPAATYRRISRSRSVRSASIGGDWRGSGRAANSAIRRLVIEGAISASPAATVLIACSNSVGPASLSRKPLAPARSAV